MKTIWYLLPIGTLAAAGVALLAWRHLDHQTDRAAWSRLANLGSPDGAGFDPAIIADLPEPARRYFDFSIAPGTPLHTAVEAEMVGEIGRGTLDDHAYRPMSARQILAPPHGLLCKVETPDFSGSDSFARWIMDPLLAVRLCAHRARIRARSSSLGLRPGCRRSCDLGTSEPSALASCDMGAR